MEFCLLSFSTLIWLEENWHASKKSIHWKNDKVFAASKSGKHIKKAYDDFFNRVEKSYVIWMKGFGYFTLSCITSAQPMNMLMAI